MTEVTDLSQPKRWKEIAEELSQENNPSKIRQLAQALQNAMLEEEREKVRQRMDKYGYSELRLHR